jgi:hypothetical protein
VDTALLACAAAERDFLAFDLCVERVHKSLCEADFVDDDLAWLSRRAGELAAAAGEEDRARAAYEMSLAQYEKMGRTDEVTALRRRLM